MTAIDIDSAAETPPEPTFDALPLSQEVRRAVDEMGFLVPTPVQLAIYGLIVEGLDLIVQARTGTGKTAAFGIPLIDRVLSPSRCSQALVLAPTRELALQSSRELAKLGKHRGIGAIAVYGGAPMEPQVSALRAGTQIVSGTPGRVLDHLQRGTMDATSMKVLVLDEADEMLSMGFAKELNAIVGLLPRERQTLLFSATVDAAVQRVAERHMNGPRFLTLSTDTVGARGIAHFVYFVSGAGRQRDLVRIIEVEDPESAIIFCNLKSETEQVAAELKQAGFNADWLNGDLPQNEREKVMARTRSGELRYLVATDVAARGIDVSHVTHVINYTFPEAIESYIHRTGRTGRAGRTGTAVSLISPQELGNLYYMRLTYKIFPIERSLPTSGELQTRSEVDRIAMLEAALGEAPGETDRAVARRLLTHLDAERIVGGLLASFFGTRGADVDEQAAAGRRARGVETQVQVGPLAREHEAAAQPRNEPEYSALKVPPQIGVEAPRPARREAEGVLPVLRGRATPPAGMHRRRDGAELAGSCTEEQGMSTLQLNVGRRDGVRPGEVARLVSSKGGLAKDEVGKILIQEGQTFVSVPTAKLVEVTAALAGTTFRDKELAAEPAE